jgi:ADP-heptose:LPS heptosyltransferase
MQNKALNSPIPAKSIFIRALGGIGDQLMVTPVIEAIKREYSNFRIFVLAKNPEIWANNPHITSRFNWERVKKINPNLCDISFDSRHRSPYQVKITGRHLIDDIYDALPFGVSCRRYQPKIYLTDEETIYKRRAIENLSRPVVAIAPFGKKQSKHPNKIYPSNQWKEVVRLLIDAGIEVIQVGYKDDGPLFRGARAWRGLGIRKTAAVLNRVDAVITHVGGIMHLATACGVPCVVLYGGVEHPHVSGYLQNVNLYEQLECAPCWRTEKCHDRKCMALLTPQKVVSETMHLLTDTMVKTK